MFTFEVFFNMDGEGVPGRVGIVGRGEGRLILYQLHIVDSSLFIHSGFPQVTTMSSVCLQTHRNISSTSCNFTYVR